MKDPRELSAEELDRELRERTSRLPADKRAALLEWIRKEFPETDGH